jgi:hypothetical protein
MKTEHIRKKLQQEAKKTSEERSTKKTWNERARKYDRKENHVDARTNCP